MKLTAPPIAEGDRAYQDSSHLLGRGRVSVVIPTLNEEENLPYVLRDLPDLVDEVIIVDGLSKDRSVEVARRDRPDCRIVFETRKGKGAAIRGGLSAITGDYIVILDADYSHDPFEIGRMIEQLDAGFDVVHGSRFLPGGGSADLTPLRFAGNKLFIWMTNLLYGTRYTDICYGYIAFRREALVHFPLMAESMDIDAELLICACGAGLRVVEVPSFERRRNSGESRLHALWDGWRILRKIVGYRFRP